MSSAFPTAWLEKAAKDLDAVRRSLVPLPDQNLETAAYHTQQAPRCLGLPVHDREPGLDGWILNKAMVDEAEEIGGSWASSPTKRICLPSGMY